MNIVFDTNGNAKQKEVARLWKDPGVTDIVYGGSKGSGKSFLGCSLIFGNALMYPETMYFIARKSLNDLRKFTIPSINEVFEKWGLGKGYFKPNGQDNYFTLYNKSTVFFLEAKYAPSDPEYARFGSMQMTQGWIEEAGEFEEAAKNNLAASIGRWKNKEYGLPGKLLQTCNPAKNYLYREYYKKKKAGELESWKQFVQALPEDNKMLPDGYLEHLRRTLNKNQRERLLLGNWEYDDDPSVLMDYEHIMDIFKNQHITGLKRYITADIARLGRDKTVIMVWDGLRVIHIKVMGKNLIPEAAKAIQDLQKRYNVTTSKVVVDEDGIGGGVVDILSCHGFVNNSKPLEVKDGDQMVKPNFDNLKSQCYFLLADYVNDGLMYIEDDTHKEAIIEELEAVKDKDIDSDMKKGVLPKEKVKELIGRSPDFSDAIMMRMWFFLTPEAWPSYVF